MFTENYKRTKSREDNLNSKEIDENEEDELFTPD